MDSSFWGNFLPSFLANFLSDLLVGAGLGVFLAWWVGKRITNFERSQHRKDEKRAEIEKARRYLEFLRMTLQSLKNALDADKDLPGLVDSEIQDLKVQFDMLKTQ